MTTTALRVEVRGDDELAARLTELGAGALEVRTHRAREEPPALVVAVGACGEDVDVTLPGGRDPAAAALGLWHARLQPWASVVQGAWFDSGPAVLHEHDPAWAALARRRLTRLGVVLGPDAMLDHIGSTAVPGLVAKAVVDLQVRLPELPSQADVTRLLAPLGYVPAPGSRPDSPGVHADARMPGDPPGLGDGAYAKRLLVAPDPLVPSILHLRLAASPFAAHVVAFRDWLRAEPAGRQRYEQAKRRLEAEHSGAADYDDYTRGKGELLRELAPVWTAWAAAR